MTGRRRVRRALVAAGVGATFLGLAAAPSSGDGVQPRPGAPAVPSEARNDGPEAQPPPGSGTPTPAGGSARRAPDDPGAQPANGRPSVAGEPTQVEPRPEREAGDERPVGVGRRSDGGGTDGSDQPGGRSDR